MIFSHKDAKSIKKTALRDLTFFLSGKVFLEC